MKTVAIIPASGAGKRLKAHLDQTALKNLKKYIRSILLVARFPKRI